MQPNNIHNNINENNVVNDGSNNHQLQQVQQQRPEQQVQQIYANERVLNIINDPAFDLHRRDAADPTTMALTVAEIEWAQTIKRAVQQEPHLTDLSDFEYVHYALAMRNEPMPAVLQRIYGMQAFKAEYGIEDTMLDAMQVMNQFTLQHPGAILAVEYLPASKNYMSIFDLASIFPREQIQTRENLRTFMAGIYYYRLCRLPHFHCIRDGHTTVVECDGMTSANLETAIFDRVVHEFLRFFPTRQKEVYFVNAPMTVTVAYGLWKRYLTENEKQTTFLDRRMPGLEDGERVASLFKVPTPEIARLRMILKAQALLQLRFHNQMHFALPFVSAG